MQTALATVPGIADQQTVDRLRLVVAADFGTALVAHDLSHLDRVARTARDIAEVDHPTDTRPSSGIDHTDRG